MTPPPHEVPTTVASEAERSLTAGAIAMINLQAQIDGLEQLLAGGLAAIGVQADCVRKKCRHSGERKHIQHQDQSARPLGMRKREHIRDVHDRIRERPGRGPMVRHWSLPFRMQVHPLFGSPPMPWRRSKYLSKSLLKPIVMRSRVPLLRPLRGGRRARMAAICALRRLNDRRESTSSGHPDRGGERAARWQSRALIRRASRRNGGPGRNFGSPYQRLVGPDF